MGMCPHSNSAVAAGSISGSTEIVAECLAVVSVLGSVASVGEPILLVRDFDVELVVHPTATGSRYEINISNSSIYISSSKSLPKVDWTGTRSLTKGQLHLQPESRSCFAQKMP